MRLFFRSFSSSSFLILAAVGISSFHSTVALAADPLPMISGTSCGEPFAARAGAFSCSYLFQSEFPSGCDQSSYWFKQKIAGRVPAIPDDVVWYTKQFTGAETVLPHELMLTDRLLWPAGFADWRIVDNCTYPTFVQLVEERTQKLCQELAERLSNDLSRDFFCTASKVLGRASNVNVEVLTIEQLSQQELKDVRIGLNAAN